MTLLKDYPNICFFFSIVSYQRGLNATKYDWSHWPILDSNISLPCAASIRYLDIAHDSHTCTRTVFSVHNDQSCAPHSQSTMKKWIFYFNLVKRNAQNVWGITLRPMAYVKGIEKQLKEYGYSFQLQVLKIKAQQYICI